MGTFTMATGFGMLAVGLVVIAIIGIGFITVVNRVEEERKQEEKQKREERRSWI